MSAQTHCCTRSNHFTPPEDRWLYRDRTIGLLRKYFQMAIEIGRLPALLVR
jgi:hypothetical protein